LTRLNRPQIEAVVAHEAGHIAGGDSLSTTVISSLSEIYEEILSKLKAGIGRASGRGGAAMILIFMVLVIMHFLSSLLRYFISREREYRADAIAVRLTRNPLSLAEGLKLISSHWRGAGAQGQRLEAIFIVNPRYSKLEESQGLFSDLFSTHPPVKKRIQILLSMAHLDEKTLEDNLKNFRRVSPVAVVEFKPADSTAPKRWFISKDQKWLGPFLLSELRQLEGFRPDQWVRMQGQDVVMPAYEDRDLKRIFTQNQEEGFNCPHCKTALEETNYEGAPMLKCPYCEGALVEQNKVSRILLRRDVKFSEDTVRLAESIINSKDKYKLKEIDSRCAWVIRCPQCRRPMRRQFFVYSYPVEIDRCMYCTGIWFDKRELELLQYIYEHRDKFFNGRYF
jgi:Zn-finger nucleic acid-binding protein